MREGIGPEIIQRMKEMLGVTLTVTLDALGPVPDDLGDGVRNVCAGDDEIAIMVLGLVLDKSRAEGNYDSLRKGLADIARGQAKLKEKHP